MVVDKIRKMTVKSVKLKSESFFLISPGVLELWRKNLKGGGFPGMDRVETKKVLNNMFIRGRMSTCILISTTSVNHSIESVLN